MVHHGVEGIGDLVIAITSFIFVFISCFASWRMVRSRPVRFIVNYFPEIGIKALLSQVG